MCILSTNAYISYNGGLVKSVSTITQHEFPLFSNDIFFPVITYVFNMHVNKLFGIPIFNFKLPCAR